MCYIIAYFVSFDVLSKPGPNCIDVGLMLRCHLEGSTFGKVNGMQLLYQH